MRLEPKIAAMGGAVALALCACGAIRHPTAFMASWLAAWWFWIGLCLGAQANLWIHRLTGGAWIDPIAAPLDNMRSALPILGLIIAPVLIWPGVLYPWAAAGWVDAARETGFRQAWLTPAGLAWRTAVCVALWITLSRRRSASAHASRAGYAAAGLLLFAYSISITATDLLMSLTPEWNSSGFGLLIITAQLKAAMSAAIFRGAGAASPPARGDLANLLLTYVMTWAYLAFTQFQIIWAENLPAEISWYVPRLQTAWVWIGVALAAVGFGLPMALLLLRAFKRSAPALRTLAALLLVMSWLEVAWWIFPSLKTAGIHPVWMLPLATLGMGGIAVAAMRSRPVRPVPHKEGAGARGEQGHA
jgi:hypothetical protein